MARTYHHHNRASSARYWNKEAKPARKATTRALRRANAELERAARVSPVDVDAIALPVLRGTLFLNLNNVNARALLALLGWAAAPSRIPLGEIRVGEPTGEFDLWGERTLPDARRAVMVARATFDRRVSALVREDDCGAPRVREDGAVEMRPVRVQSFGLDAEGLRDRLESFAALVEEGGTLGAVKVTWG